MKLRVMDLFSGIGGFSLGLKRTGGFKTVGYCEINETCQQRLQDRFADGTLDIAPICTDVERLDGKPWAGRIDVITGGFPCQDISTCGTTVKSGQGIDGERSGLWREMGRLVCEIRPRYIVVENSPELVGRGLGRVLGDLASGWFDAEWDCLPAAAFGAPHIRDRIWILAYSGCQSGAGVYEAGDGRPFLFPKRDNGSATERREDRELVEMVPGVHQGVAKDWWRAQSRMDRSVNGLPGRMDRLHALGNSIVPQIAEWIGRRILECAK